MAAGFLGASDPEREAGNHSSFMTKCPKAHTITSPFSAREMKGVKFNPYPRERELGITFWRECQTLQTYFEPPQYFIYFVSVLPVSSAG